VNFYKHSINYENVTWRHSREHQPNYLLCSTLWRYWLPISRLDVLLYRLHRYRCTSHHARAPHKAQAHRLDHGHHLLDSLSPLPQRMAIPPARHVEIPLDLHHQHNGHPPLPSRARRQTQQGQNAFLVAPRLPHRYHTGTRGVDFVGLGVLGLSVSPRGYGSFLGIAVGFGVVAALAIPGMGRVETHHPREPEGMQCALSLVSLGSNDYGYDVRTHEYTAWGCLPAAKAVIPSVVAFVAFFAAMYSDWALGV
jgi:hypothetical protein